VRRLVSVHANPDSGCDADANRVPGVLTFQRATDPEEERSASGSRVSREPRRRSDAEGSDRPRDTGGGILCISFDQAAFLSRSVERLHAVSGAAIFLVVAAPGTFCHPPNAAVLDFTMHSAPGSTRFSGFTS